MGGKYEKWNWKLFSTVDSSGSDLQASQSQSERSWGEVWVSLCRLRVLNRRPVHSWGERRSGDIGTRSRSDFSSPDHHVTDAGWLWALSGESTWLLAELDWVEIHNFLFPASLIHLHTHFHSIYSLVVVAYSCWAAWSSHTAAADKKGGKVDEHDDDVECMSEILCKSFFISIMCISCVHELILEIFILRPLSARRHERDEIWEMLGKILLKLKLFWKLDSKADEQEEGRRKEIRNFRSK